MMTNQPEDVIVGKAVNGKKQDGSVAKFTDLILYEIDAKTRQPVPTGTFFTYKNNGKTEKIPNYKISAIYRIADSSLLKVKGGQSKSCNIYWRPR